MNKKAVIKILIFLILITGIISISYGVYSETELTYTRDELENRVVDTAMSYEYNRFFSDYEQRTMNGRIDFNSDGQYISGIMTVNFRNFNQTPESICRGNKFNIDCSSFTTSVYINSVGLDFSQYYESLGRSSVQEVKEKYSDRGSGLSTKELRKLNKELIVYDKTFSSSTKIGNDKKLSDILDGTDSTVVLNKGDLINVKYESGSGHLMLFTGKKLGGSERLIIHSTGVDYNLSNIEGSEDNNSIRFSNMQYLKDKSIVQFTIIRPLNVYCNGDTCKIKKYDASKCDESTGTCRDADGYVISGYASKNIDGRHYARRLRLEQYARKEKYSYDSENYTQYISHYNSVEKGNKITYALYTRNKSDTSFCIGASNAGTYSTKSECEANGFKWMKNTAGRIAYYGTNFAADQTELDKYDYSYRTTISAKIPYGTTYASCTYSCKYDEPTRTVTWDSFPYLVDEDKTFAFTVKVNMDNTNDELDFKGYNFKFKNGAEVDFDSIKTNISPTLSKDSQAKLISYAKNFDTLFKTGKITVASSQTGNYKDLDLTKSTRTNSISLAREEFIKALYYNLGIDIPDLTFSNIKNSLFTQKVSSSNSNDIYYTYNSAKSTIQSMYVKDGIGGTLLSGKYKTRVHYINTAYLEPGDIIYTYGASDDNLSRLYIYLGNDDTTPNIYKTSDMSPIFAALFGDSVEIIKDTTASKKILRNLYQRKLFVILRPTKTGKTVYLNYNKEESLNNTTQQYMYYKDLPTTQTKSYTVNFYDGTTKKSTSSLNASLSGWYANKELTGTVIKNGAQTQENDHTLYAKWNEPNVLLSSITKKGYTLKGWYKEKEFTNLVGAPGASVKVTSDLNLYAKYDINQYTITFNSNGGSSVSSITKNYNAEVTEPNEPTKSNYTFAGWYKDETLTELYTFDKMPAENITLYAKWTSESYKITYVLNGGTNNKSNKTTFTSGETVTLLSPTKTGYKFEGWYKESTFTNKITTIDSTYTSNVSVYAKWSKVKYHIYLYDSNSTLMDTKDYYYQDAINITNPTKAGYEFIDWYDSSLTEKAELTSMPANNINIYAKWNVINYTITYSYRNTKKTKKYNIETATFTIAPPTVEGYIFKKWYDEDNKIELSTLSINKGTTGNKNYTIHYEPITYKIHYDPNGGTGTINDQTYSYEDVVELENNRFTRNGYTFLGWSTNKNATKPDEYEGTISALTSVNNQTITFYAIWEKESKRVEVNAVNGTVDENVKLFTTVIPTFNVTPNSGYIFKNVVCTNNQKATFNKNVLSFETITNDTVCTVNFALPNYSITYNLNGGYFDEDPINTFTKDTETITLPIPKKNNYIFKGWITSNNSSPNPNFQILKGTTNDVSVEAVWEANKYTISFNANGGEGTMNNVTYTYGVDLNLPENAYTKEGYIFKGWVISNTSTSVKFNDKANVNGKITSNVTLYALWEKNTYIVTVNVENGRIVNETNIFEVNKNDDLAFDAVPNNGYKNANISCTNNQIMSKNNNTFNIYNLSSDTVCTINFVLAQYKITYLLNGGTANNPSTYKMTDNITLNNPTKKGYDFTGWTGSNGQTPTKDITITNSYGDKSYEANYTIHTYSVKYESNEYGTITGTKQENINYNSSPQLNITYTPNTGYKLLKIIVDNDVKLDDNTTIYANQEITAEQIKKIKVDKDLTIKYIFSLTSNKVKFESDSNIKILGSKEETVNYNDTINALNYEVNEGYSLDYVILDKDVIINNTTVTKGTHITIDNVNKIKVIEPLTVKLISKTVNYTITFINDENSSITSKTQTKTIIDKIEIPEYTINQGYILDYWYSNETLKLVNGKVYEPYTKILNEDVQSIVINKNINLYLKTIKENIKLTFSITNKDLTKGDLVVNYTESENFNMFNNECIFISDKDLELTDNTIIKANEEFNLVQLKKIKFKEDINITVINKGDNIILNIPDTSKFKLNIYILGIIIVLIGYLLIDYNSKLYLFKKEL